MQKIILFTFLRVLFAADAYPSAHPSSNSEELSCVTAARADYNKMPKLSKITVNRKIVDYFSFEDNPSAVIHLNLSMSEVRLPMLNMSYTNLLLLEASFNGLEKVGDIGNETFSSLRLLNLSHNILTSVNSFVFHHLKELEILDLSYNCFVKFHYDHVFLHHENLKTLLLQNNRLLTIQSTFVEPKLLTLNKLDFSNNFISEFSNYEIQINHLIMKNNLLKNVVIFHASDMKLEGSNNKMVHFFAPQGNFRHLDLSYNNFEFLSYIEVESATKLNLSHNKLHTWSQSDDEMSAYIDDDPKDIFDKSSYQRDLQERIGVRSEFINLAHNDISSIEELRHFKNCKELNLDSNKFENVHPPEFNFLFPLLNRVVLTNNPLSQKSKANLDRFNNELSNQLKLKFYFAPPQTSTLHPLLIPIILPTLPTLPPPAAIRFFSPTIASKKINSLASTTPESAPAVPESTSEAPSTLQRLQTNPTSQSNLIIKTTKIHRHYSHHERPTEKKPLSIFTGIIAAVCLLIIIATIVYSIHKRIEVGSVRYQGFHDND